MSESPGLLAVWTDIQPALEADFNDWYDREHLAERAGIPGFHSARRYIAEAAEPKYFSLYETDSIGVFASPEYRRYYLGPAMSAWSKRIMPAFLNNHRRCCRLVARGGGGIGGAVASLRFRAADTLEARLAGRTLAPAL